MKEPRTIAILAFAQAGVFAALLVAVVGFPAVTRIDEAINLALAPLRSAGTVHFFIWVTALGSGAVLLPVLVTTTVAFGLQRSAGLRGLWLGYVGTIACVWLVKFAVLRPRPPFLTVVTAASPSFPSEHAAGAAVVYGILARLAMRGLPEGDGRRGGIAALAAALIFAVGFSRVFLSVHYSTDVLGGYALAGFWICMAARFAPAR